MDDKSKFVSGMYFNEKREGAPDFVLGSLSFIPEKFVEWIKAQKPNEKGYVRVSIKKSRENKIYAEIDLWEKPSQEALPVIQTELPSTKADTQYAKATAEAPNPDDIPFN